MNSRFLASAVALAAVLIGVAAVSQTQSKPKSSKSSLVARGRYLVNNVGVCGDCHTPMDQMGHPVKGKTLHGSALFFKPTVPVPGWVDKAPAIAGLPTYSDQQAITFFMTGKKPNGAQAAPPMPRFRFNKADATAITAYLKSLPPAK